MRTRATNDTTSLVEAFQLTNLDEEADEELFQLAEGAGWNSTVNGDGSVTFTKNGQSALTLHLHDWLAFHSSRGQPTGQPFVITAAEMNSGWRQLGG